MRKLIIGILSFTIFFINVSADERYYLDKDNKKGEYLSNMSSLQSNYKYRDYDDLLYLNYSDWQDYCDVDLREYEIQNKEFYVYQNIYNIKFIKLDNFSKENNIIKLDIYEGEDLIDYKLMKCDNCSDNIENVKFDDVIIIELEKDIDINNLDIDIEFNDEINYVMSLSDDEEMNNIVLKKEITSDIQDINLFDDILDDEKYYIIDKLGEDNYIDVVNRCRYRKYLVYNYNLDEINYVNSGLISEDNNKVMFEVKYLEDVKDDNKDNDNVVSEVEYSNEEDANKNEIKKEEDVVDLKPDTKYVKSLKISNNKSLAKYLILVVIILTILYIIYTNKRISRKNKK